MYAQSPFQIQSKKTIQPVGNRVKKQSTAISIAQFKVLQRKNSDTPNWYQEYQKVPAIHNQGIANYIAHVEQGQGNGGNQTGLHSLVNGNPPAGVTIADQNNVGYNSIGKILWYVTGNPGANGTAHNPIPVKSSTVFPTRLSNNFNNITGVRALMKAAAANNGFNEIEAGAGLTGNVQHNPGGPTIFPSGGPLRNAGAAFNNGLTHYRAM